MVDGRALLVGLMIQLLDDVGHVMVSFSLCCVCECFLRFFFSFFGVEFESSNLGLQMTGNEDGYGQTSRNKTAFLSVDWRESHSLLNVTMHVCPCNHSAYHSDSSKVMTTKAPRLVEAYQSQAQ